MPTALGLLIVIVISEVPPTGMLVGENVLVIVGGRSAFAMKPHMAKASGIKTDSCELLFMYVPCRCIYFPA